ncbi:hypothetical protein JZ751_003037 [Albula glossodonta]|uniref:Uncharacterized protein n=1 Tax=Albula glossodonta TaxID=121402 RepID=A0A8T2N8M0_9TELE|nr:hypothetical protein JZ751_003037 [Albula glossodonta]
MGGRGRRREIDRKKACHVKVAVKVKRPKHTELTELWCACEMLSGGMLALGVGDRVVETGVKEREEEEEDEGGAHFDSLLMQ